jgi:zinc protease
VARRRQFFSVWIRPVQPPTAHFALRAGLHEVDRLIERGLTAEELDLTRSFLINYSKLWAQTLPDRLGFLMDSEYLGMPYWIDEIETRLAALDVETVNAAVRKYLSTGAYEAVLVTDDAEAAKAYLEADEPSPIEYNAAKPEAILEADKAIQTREIAPTSVVIVPVAEMFEGDATPE